MMQGKWSKKPAIAKRRALDIVLLASLTLLLTTAQAFAVTVLPPTSHPLGKTYAQWSAKWWKWAGSIPLSSNPINDQTGQNCDLKQSGHVWYLAGTSGGTAERTCTIPKRHFILLPTINIADAELPANFNEAAIRSQLKSVMDHASNIELVVDGVPLKSYRVQSPVFKLTVPPDNFFNISTTSPTTAKAVSDGFWAMLPPLSVREHEIKLGGEIHCSSCLNGQPFDFTEHAIYHITIK
jgi:hypothetical protein